MRQQCINSAEKAIGRSFNDGEVDFVDAAIARAGADLQAQNPDAWSQMSPAEQWRAAGQRAAEVMRAEAQQLVEQAEGGVEVFNQEETDGRRPEQTGDGRRRYSSGGLAPLEGAPIVRSATGPDPGIVAVAEQYAAANGIDLRRQARYAIVDIEFACIAQAYIAPRSGGLPRAIARDGAWAPQPFRKTAPRTVF